MMPRSWHAQACAFVYFVFYFLTLAECASLWTFCIRVCVTLCHLVGHCVLECVLDVLYWTVLECMLHHAIWWDIMY